MSLGAALVVPACYQRALRKCANPARSGLATPNLRARLLYWSVHKARAMQHPAIMSSSVPEPVVPTRIVSAVQNHHHRNELLGGILVATLVIGGLFWHRAHTPTAPAFRFELTSVDRGPIQAKVTATGVVNPIVTVQVGSQVSGTIEKLGADFNSVVTPGQMVAQIDRRLFRASVDQAHANLMVTRANTHKARIELVDAKRTAARNRVLGDQKLVAQSAVDTSDTAAAAAAANLEQALASETVAQAALATATTNLAYTTITSPIAGTVISRNVDVGQTVAASFAAPTLCLIGQDLTKMKVDTSIAEADVGSLASGMIATFTVDAYPSHVFTGAISEVRSAPQVVQNVVTYDAVVNVENPKLELKPGMTANLEVIYADRKDVVRVSNAALRFRPSPEIAGTTSLVPPTGKKLLWVLRQGAPHPVEITAGVTDGTNTEVIDGELRVGDQVVTEANATHHVAGAGRIL